MKKKLITGLACFTAGIGLAGCGVNNSSQPTEIATTETTTTTTETTTITEATRTQEARANTELYNEIINTYYLARQTECPSWAQLPEGINNLFPEYSERSKGVGNDFITSVCDTSPSYYAIHDFDNNGVEELAIFNGEGLSALYTISGDEVIPLAFGQSRNMLKISDEGDVYLWSHGGWQDYQIYKFRFSEDGNSLQVVYYKAINGNNPDGSIIYYSCPAIAGESFFNLEIGETEKISEEELRKAEDEYNSVECTLEKLPLQEFPPVNQTPSTTETPTPTVKSKTSETKTDTGEYLLYDSDKQILTNRDIKDLSFSDLRKARNEILARHGRMFKDTILQNYFSSKSWYKPSIDPDEFDRNVESYLNDIEIKNVEFIKSVEDKYNSNTEGYSDEELKKKVIAHYKSNYVGEGVEEKILANAEDYIYNGDGTDLSYREIRSMGQDVIAIYLVEDDSDKNVALAYPEIPWNYYIKRSTGRGKIINWRTNEIKEVDINGY